MKFLAATGLALLLLAAPASASFHLMKIVEVFPGTPASPNAQYVVLQMYADFQNFVTGHAVIVYNASGAEIGRSTFAADVGSGVNQSRILIATSSAQSFFNVAADLTMQPIIPAAGGKVCFDAIDCVGWGMSATTTDIGTPFNAPVGLVRGQAIKRRLNICGGIATLEDCDDTNNSANDFAAGTPSPRNNANVAGTIPPSVCGDAAIQSIEQCDDGNTTSGDGCTATCLWEPEAIVPQSIVVDPSAGPNHNGNGVFEPGEMLPFLPSWTNTGISSIPLTGNVGLFGGPAGPSYAIGDGVADYGTLPASATGTCLTAPASCYAVIAAGVRPSLHWDATVWEVLSNGSAKQWTLHVGQSFSDVPASGFYRFIETIFHHGITAGCTQNNFCPDAAITRAQMAVFLLVTKFGPAYGPPPATGTVFQDVQTNTFGAAFIEDLYRRGITGGCSLNPPLYCPGSAVTREQMAVFLLRTKFGSSYVPPAATGIFDDVPAGNGFARWIEELYRLGITGGCSAMPPLYCPGNPNTRGQMSVFLTSTFGLKLYAP